MIGLLLWACTTAPPDGRADVWILSVDTLRADHLGYAGHPGAHTPHLDALAARAIDFTQATTPFPRTTPALASLHTGLWPHHHGSREVGQRMDAHPTLASQLAAAGWQTTAVSAMQVAGPEQGLHAGFDTFTVAHDAPAAQLSDTALAQLGALSTDAPALMWVHYADPHFPYLPAADAPLQPEARGCRKVVRKASAGKLRRAPLFANRGGRAQALLEQCSALYDAEISAVDAAIGSLLEDAATLRGERPRWVVFTADHGEHLGEAGLYYEHGPDVHDANLRIPLLVSGPGIASRRDDGIARLEDISPTLLDALGVAAAPSDGEPLGLAEAGGPTLAFAESGSALQVPLHGYLVSGRDKRWCLNHEQYAWCGGTGEEPTLHDWRSDPGLDTDLSANQPLLASTLARAAGRWPPEHARERTVRSDTHRLVSTPELDGRVLSCLDLAGRPVDSQACEPLQEPLARFEAELDGPLTTTRDAAQLEALQALGYVE